MNGCRRGRYRKKVRWEGDSNALVRKKERQKERQKTVDQGMLFVLVLDEYIERESIYAEITRIHQTFPTSDSAQRINARFQNQANQTLSTQRLNQDDRPLRRDHDAELRINRKRLDDGAIHNVQILHPDDRRINIDAGADTAGARPMVDLTDRVRRRGGDVGLDLGLGGGDGDIVRGEARSGEGLENVVDESGDVDGVLGVGVVDARGARDEVGVEDDGAGGFEARGAVDVERDGVGVGVLVVAGGADGALHAGLGAVGVGDVVPEDADFAGKGVRAVAGVEVEGGVGCDGVIVLIGVGLDGGGGEGDEGVWVVEEAGADGGVVDPGGGREAAEFVRLGEAGQDGGGADAGFHQEFGGFQGAAADDDSASGV